MKKFNLDNEGLVELTEFEYRRIEGGRILESIYSWARKAGQAMADFFADIGDTAGNAYYYPI
jgi:hypothetical protein